MRVITIGGATQDIFLNYRGADSITLSKRDAVQHYMIFESGEKIEIDDIVSITGGGATNSAVSFRRQGFDVTTLCNIGQDDAGARVREMFLQNNIESRLVQCSEKFETGKSFIINSLRGERTIFAHRGANNHLNLQPLACEDLSQAHLLYITSLSNESAKILPKITACAQNLKIPIAMNPGSSQLTQGADILKEALKHVKILILNSSEARTFMISLINSDERYKQAWKTKQPHDPSMTANHIPYLLNNPIAYNNLYFSMQHFFKAVLMMGPEIVVITNGANGVYTATKNATFFHPSIKTHVVDTVGAGDAFGSCFTASLMQGYSLENALRRGIMNSSSVLGFLGAKQGLLTREELDEKVENIDEMQLQQFPPLE